MKVIDAGVVIELLANDLDPDELGDEELAAPHLIDSEVTNVFRRLVARNALTDKLGGDAFASFTRLTITRFPADWLRPRMWALRHNLSALRRHLRRPHRNDRRHLTAHHRRPPRQRPRHQLPRRSALS